VGLPRGLFTKYFNSDSKKETKEKWSYFKLVMQTINVMHNQLNELATYHHKPDITIPISFRAADTFDFYKAKELIEYGRVQAAKAIDEYEKTN
jgi:NTE family protein